MSTFPLRWPVDAGRLGIVAHAALLHAGFVPCVDDPTGSAHLLSRRYTMPQLAGREEGAAAEVAVLEPRAMVGNGGGIAFQAFLVTRDGGGGVVFQAYLLARDAGGLPEDELPRPTLATEPTGAWLWRSLADWVPRSLLLELPASRFASLPDDAVAEILKRLADGTDLARAECASRQLRRVATERDGELWKALYGGLMPWASRSIEPVAGSWKERYVESHPRPLLWRLTRTLRHHRFLLYSHYEYEVLAQLRRERQEALRARFRELPVSLMVMEDCFDVIAPREPMVWPFYSEPLLYPPPAPAREVVAGPKNAGRQHRKVPRNDYRKKRHGTGAINSPSSRYRWNHR